MFVVIFTLGVFYTGKNGDLLNLDGNNNIEIEKPLLSTKPWARPAIDALQILLLILVLARPDITLFILKVKNMRTRESES